MLLHFRPNKWAALFLCCAWFCSSSCDVFENDDDNQVAQPYENGVFVLNEGAFNAGNASVSFINPSTKAVSNDIFAAANNRPLGDVAQSISFWKDYAFVLVNNSQKIEVVEAATFKSVGTISNLASPRFMQVVSDTKAYVTNIFSNEITVINPSTFAHVSTISVPCGSDGTCWTEQMYLSGNKLYVANTGAGTVMRINTDTDEIEATINTVAQPSDLAFSAATNRLWVLCLGGYGCFPATCQPASLQAIELSNNSISRTLNYNGATDQFVSNLQLNADGSKAMLLNNGAYEIDLTQTSDNNLQTAAQPLFVQPFGLYGGRYNNPAFNYGTYLTDAQDFAQNGVLYKMTNNGAAIIDTFEVGVAPSKVYFH